MSPEQLVESVTSARRIPPCEELLLRVADEPITPWAAAERLTGSLEEAPFWAHAWPGGLALARYVLDHPSTFAGQRVLDFASGCGVSAVAAATVGAHVLATELDPFALAAIALNARLNHVKVDTFAGDVIDRDDGWNVVLVGDVFYRAELARRVMGWLTPLVRRGATVLIGDPGRQFLPQDRLTCVATFDITAVPAWDSVIGRPARVWALR